MKSSSGQSPSVGTPQHTTSAAECQAITFHKAADIFPLMEGEEFEALASDIKKNGLLQPIWTYRGEIIDGRNRYRACYKVDVEPQFKTWDGRGSLLSFIISMNLKRRHLNESQRAMIATDLVNMTHGGDRKSDDFKATHGALISQPEAAELTNVSRRTVQRAIKVQEKATPTQIKDIEKGKKTVTEVLRQVSRAKPRPTPVLPTGVYDVIYADPPWCYEFSETKSREIQNKYQTMSLEEICDLKIPAANNAALFLWATAPKLQEALRVMEFWGFAYRTHAIWNKGKIGMGYWFRGQHELLLVGVKGSFSPPNENNRFGSVITAERTEHSRKPDCIYNIIESMLPGCRYLELFSRCKREGWTMWGLDT